jgi:hypothetical protein
MSAQANESAASVRFLASPLAVAMACVMVGAAIWVSWLTTGLYRIMAVVCVCVASIQLGLTIYYRYLHRRFVSLRAFEATVLAFQGWFYIGVALLSVSLIVFGNVVLGTIGLVVCGPFGCWAAHRGRVRLRRLSSGGVESRG